MRLMVKYLILPSAPTIAAGSGWGRCRWLNAYKITFSGTKEMHDGFFDLFLPVLLKNMICKFRSHCDKIVLKKPRWVVLLFKNFHSVLCFNHGFYQQLGALFWGLAALQWFVCRVPWAGACPSLLPWCRQGDTEASWENFTADLGELQLPLRNLPSLEQGASLPDQLVVLGN